MMRLMKTICALPALNVLLVEDIELNVIVARSVLEELVTALMSP